MTGDRRVFFADSEYPYVGGADFLLSANAEQILDDIINSLAHPAEIYQAEDATLSGVIVETEHPSLNGSGFADFVVSPGGFIKWQIPVEVGGTYALSFRYANGDAGGSSRPLKLQVNAAVANPSLSFPGTPNCRGSS